MNENKSERLNKKSCLFLSKRGIQRVICPFSVLCIKSIRTIRKGDWVQVEEVEDWDSFTILFTIKGKMYPHHYFCFYQP